MAAARSWSVQGVACSGVPGHDGHVGPAGLVVHEHHRDGAAVAGEAGRHHGLEEDVLLLAVVAGVGELPDEAHEAGELGPLVPAAGDSHGEGIEGVEGAEDELVLLHEQLDGVRGLAGHDFFPLGAAFFSAWAAARISLSSARISERSRFISLQPYQRE